MIEITAQQIRDLVKEAKSSGLFYPNALLISKPHTPYIKIAGNKFFCTPNPLIGTFDGIEIYFDELVEKDKFYLVDKNTIRMIQGEY